MLNNYEKLYLKMKEERETMSETLKEVLLAVVAMATVPIIVIIVAIAAINSLSAHYALERCIKAKEAGLNLEECKGE